LPEHYLNVTETIVVHGQGEELLARIRGSRNWDEEVVKAAEALGDSGSASLHAKEWSIQEGLVLKEGKVYVPRDEHLRTDILKVHHDLAIAGHPGIQRTRELIARNYWWPRLGRTVHRYVTACDLCQRNKNIPRAPQGKLQPNPIPTGPWKDLSVDFVTHLPSSQGYNAILVVVDRFSKQIHLIPMTEEMSSEGLARLFRDNVWKLHGLPETIISDRGPQFASQFTKDLNKLLGIQTKLSTATHPQTDSQTERVNQDEATSALKVAQEEMKHYADRKRRTAPIYKAGDKVWIDTADLRLNRSTHKLAERRIGPYPVIKMVGLNAVELRLPPSIKIHPVVNISRVHPYHAPMLEGQGSTPQPPIIIGEEEEFEVECILNSRIHRNRLQFLIKWQGYTGEHNTWEDENDCRHVKVKISEFY
jgi:hypothetical protein